MDDNREPCHEVGAAVAGVVAGAAMEEYAESRERMAACVGERREGSRAALQERLAARKAQRDVVKSSGA